MDLNDARFHRKVIPWRKLEAEGIEPRKVMKEAQKQKMWVLARKAEHRWQNNLRLAE
ncbi:MAG: hypothetical protein GOVbin2277_64 [Prokaryotic dsDNA virus sp.]|jgi:hypothetical protein|nr:MAG: hypothetical protein GOVbin2277_64 [Prokaryotic dsDNA virus sp.]|tara:strand:- start:2310 stop:2480 length:171 start_codon:yes stop_codon:yes gene_type:complete